MNRELPVVWSPDTRFHDPCHEVWVGVATTGTEVAARVDWFGAGKNLRSGTPSPEAVRRAVRTVLTDESYRRAARDLQRAYARRDAATELAALVDEVIAEREPRTTARHG